MTAEWSAFSRDGAYQVSGALPIIAVKGVRRHLGVDACELVTPYTPAAYGRLAPGCGIVVQRDGRQQFSGLVGSSRKIEWDAGSAGATITVQCVGDVVHLADRLVYPSPYASPTAQMDDYWLYTGPASTAMWRLIRDQAGPSAQAGRRVSTLVMGDDPVVGTSALWGDQWSPMLETLTKWGRRSGTDLGVRIRTTPDGLLVDITNPPDVYDRVRFSASLTNLTGWSYEETPPEVTIAIAAGQGLLRNRVRRVAASARAGDLAWGRRIESYVDQRDEADTTKLQQSASDTIIEGIGTVELSTTAADTPTAAYGDAWDVGHRVTVHIGLPDGPIAATVVDVIREVAFDVDDRGRETITPAIGTPDAQVFGSASRRRMSKIAAGLARLARNQ